MTSNPLQEVQKLGQSIWYDNIQRSMIQSGALKQMISAGDIQGITSNPTIFEKAIAGSKDYDTALQDQLHADPNISLKQLYESLAIEDIQNAADLLRPYYDKCQCQDGYISLEVSPKLAHDTQGTIDEGRRLFAAVKRPNVMIKVPATHAGLPAVTALLGEGINVNVTLMFSLRDYADVSNAYLSGLEYFIAKGGNPQQLASVASYFVSRIDAAIDKLLPPDSPLAGKIAIANAKLAYARFQEVFSSPRFMALKAKGANVQRPLWASTGTKNPKYRDVMYIEELIGPDTVNTVPTVTLDAFRDHGEVRNSLVENISNAQQQIDALAQAGVDLSAVTTQLKVEGVESFSKSFDSLLATLTNKQASILSAKKA